MNQLTGRKRYPKTGLIDQATEKGILIVWCSEGKSKQEYFLLTAENTVSNADIVNFQIKLNLDFIENDRRKLAHSTKIVLRRKVGQRLYSKLNVDFLQTKSGSIGYICLAYLRCSALFVVIILQFAW